MKEKLLIKPVVSVDLSHDFPSIRDQNKRPLCLVFSGSDLNSYNNSISEHLSVEYLAHFSYKSCGSDDYHNGLPLASVKYALSNTGQPLEKLFPYNNCDSGIAPRTPKKINELYYSEDLAEDRSISLKEIIKYLDKRKPVLLCLELTPSFFTSSNPLILDQEQGNHGGHAVIAVGYGCLPTGETTVLIRNSWGNNWGEDGHAWLTSEFIRNRVFASMILG